MAGWFHSYNADEQALTTVSMDTQNVDRRLGHHTQVLFVFLAHLNTSKTCGKESLFIESEEKKIQNKHDFYHQNKFNNI